MKVPGNGRTRAAIISAICAALLAIGGVVGQWNGYHTKVAREAVREQRIDDHLLKALPRLDAVERKTDAVESTANANAIAIGELKVEVSRLVKSQETLTNTLMDYLKAEATRTRVRP